MPSDTRSILVIGAGELGLPVISHLSQRARLSKEQTITISVLVRPSTLTSSATAKQAEISHLRDRLNVTLLPGDITADSQTTLTAIFKPYHTIICCTGFSLGASGVQLKIAQAVLAAGTPLFLPWQFGADYDAIGRGGAQDLFDEQLDVRELLGSQERTRWVVVSVGVFMTFMFEGFWGVVDLEGGVCRALGGWDRRITATTPRDIGRCVAEVVVDSGVDVERGEGEWWGGGNGSGSGSAMRKEMGMVLRLAGDTKTYGEVADIVERVTGRKMRRQLWTVDELQKVSREDPKHGLKKYRVVFAQEIGCAWDVEKSFNYKRGIKMESMEEWLKAKLQKR